MGINLPCYTFSEIQGMKRFSAMKATSRACGVAARNNPVSCNFSLKPSKWQRQLAGIPFSLFLNPFLPKIEARVKGGSGVKLPHMSQSESYLSSAPQFVSATLVSWVLCCFQLCAEACDVIVVSQPWTNGTECPQERGAKPGLWVLLQGQHCPGEVMGIGQ